MTKSIKALGGSPLRHVFNHCRLCHCQLRFGTDDNAFDCTAYAHAKREVVA